MKYCIDYQGKNNKIFDTIEEINIDITKIKTENLLEFCKLHTNQRINLCIEDYNEAIDKKLLFFAFDFQKDNPNLKIYIRLPFNEENYSKDIKKMYPKCKLYFKTFVNNWDQLYEYIDWEVTDIYITEQLGFELENISKVLNEKHIQIRVFPNVAQCEYKKLDDILKFWIRPEDIENYEPYIDICEFYGDIKKQELYYSIYHDDKKWMGDLKEIIIDLQDSVDSTCIVPRFPMKRVNCGRSCMKGGSCQMCNHIYDLAKNLNKTTLRIIKEDFKDGTRTDSESGNSKKDIK